MYCFSFVYLYCFADILIFANFSSSIFFLPITADVLLRFRGLIGLVAGHHRGIVYVDDLVPASLRDALNSHLDILAELEVKDFHPGADGKVQGMRLRLD
jgi:hypothetical protein